MSQPNVPFWFAAVIVTASAICAAALAYPDTAFAIAPTVKFGLFLVNVGLTVLAAFLNIKKPETSTTP